MHIWPCLGRFNKVIQILHQFSTIKTCIEIFVASLTSWECEHKRYAIEKRKKATIFLAGISSARACLLVAYFVFFLFHLSKSSNWMHNSNKSVGWQASGLASTARTLVSNLYSLYNCILGPISLFLLFTTFQTKVYITHFLDGSLTNTQTHTRIHREAKCNIYKPFVHWTFIVHHSAAFNFIT